MEKFLITEEEKSRILGMHIYRTQRQYLMEYDTSKMKSLFPCVGNYSGAKATEIPDMNMAGGGTGGYYEIATGDANHPAGKYYESGQYVLKGQVQKFYCDGNNIKIGEKPKVVTPQPQAKPQAQPQAQPQQTADNQCSLECNKRYPYNAVVCEGGNWNKTLNAWIKEKGGGKNSKTNTALRTAWCSGWRPEGTTTTTIVGQVPPGVSTGGGGEQPLDTKSSDERETVGGQQ